MDDRFALVPISSDLEEPRCACVLVLDVSTSMSIQNRIGHLNKGLQQFATELSNDPLASKRVEVAIVTFGQSVNVAMDFTQAREFRPPTLSANGHTPMGEAVCKATELLETRKSVYKNSGIDYYRPWIFLITDGAPTDTGTPHWPLAVSQVADGDDDTRGKKKFSFFAVGVDGTDFTYLRTLSVREPLELTGLKFVELFSWLSKSMQSISGSTTGEQVDLESPAGWGSVAPR